MDLPLTRPYNLLRLTGIFICAVFLHTELLSAQFNPLKPDLTPVDNPAIDAGDFDDDGDVDLAIAGRLNVDQNLTVIYENDGSGSFSTFQDDLQGISGGDVKWGDYDNDGDLDLVVVGWDAFDNPTATIYENRNNEFVSIDQDLDGIVAGSAAWGDYDDDGDLDLLIAGTSGDINATATLYENRENNTFTPVDARLRGVRNGSVAWGDYNQDGKLDLVITGRDRDNFPVTLVYENKGDGKFEQVGANLMGVFGDTSVEWGDFNNDDYPDLVVTGWNANLEPTTVVYKNYKGDSLSSIEDRFMGVGDGEARWVDYNQNNRLDLMVTGMSANNTVITIMYRNNADNGFTRTDTEFDGLWRSALIWDDFNGNGMPDLIMTGINENNKRDLIYQINEKTVAEGSE